MPIEITSISEPLELGEGPHWDPNTQSLYFVDIYKSTIHRYVPSSNQHHYTKVGEKPVTFIIPVKGKTDEYVISYGNDIALIKWDGINDISDFKILITLEENSPKLRFNDGKTSPRGILFAGTMLQEKFLDDFPGMNGSFYSFLNQKVKKHFDGIGISNGLAWSSDEKLFYYIDSLNFKVEAFDYDAEKVELSNRRTIFNFTENNIKGFPDGMTIDNDGNLWVACFDASQVIKIDPKTGQLLTSIELPSKITSVAFGGETLEDLYVTSAYIEIFTVNPEVNPKAGCLFKITGIGVKGIAGVPVNF